MARISELHYSNAYARSSGVEEFLEVALKPGEDPADFVVSFYQANGSVGLEVPLDHPDVELTFDADANEYIYVISNEAFGMKLTDPDGSGTHNYEAFALTNSDSSEVLQFYDIGGGTQDIIANGGAADGSVSENIPVPTDPNMSTYSIQFNVDDPDQHVYQTVSKGDTGVICFAEGTKIRTPKGDVAIEHIRKGDLVDTEGNGPKKVRWIGRSDVLGFGPLAPIKFDTGAIGNTAPLRLSPHHKVLIAHPNHQLFFGAPDVLVSAHLLLNDQTIMRAPVPKVSYFHLMFDDHQIIFAEGAPVESFFVSHTSLGMLAPDARQEFCQLFPELFHDPRAFGPLARTSLKRSEVPCLIS